MQRKKKNENEKNNISSSKHCHMEDVYPKIAQRKLVFGIVFFSFSLQRCFQLVFKTQFSSGTKQK